MGKLIGNVHSDAKPRKVSDSKKSEKSSQTSSAGESRSSRKVSEEKESGIIKGVHKSEDDYVSLDIDDDEDSSSSRRSRSSRQREDIETSSSLKESAQNAIDSAKENINRIKESSNNFFANGLKDDKEAEKPAQAKEEKETDDVKEQEAQEAEEAKEAIEKQEADKAEIEAKKVEEKALKAAGVDADVEIPNNLKGNYYGIYNYLVSEQSEGYHEAQLAAQKLMSDENIWNPSSMSTTKEKLKEKIEGIFNVNGSVFQGKDVADTIVESALENNLNPEMFAAKIMAENDLGTGSRSHTYKNPGWVRGADQTYKVYGSINEGIRDMANLLGNAPQYNLSQGSKSMVEVDSVYAPGNTTYSEFLAKRLIAIQQYNA